MYLSELDECSICGRETVGNRNNDPVICTFCYSAEWRRKNLAKTKEEIDNETP